ncbi:MAG: tRNA lysidine(34) synthetase TilS [Pseudomonadota bacterium]
MPRLTSSPVVETAGAIPSPILEAFQGLVPTGPFGVAVSGGGDSKALLAMAHLLRPDDVLAATVDHGLRPEASQEARTASDWCQARRIPHQTLSAEGLKCEPGNLQSNARDMRYDLLAGWAAESAIHSVLLGHTMDDQAETVLMRLARGSGAEGLSGMAETREWEGVTFLRPLLRTRRAELRTWLSERGETWIDDPTNEDASFDRIKARQALDVLAPLGISVEGLAATADRLRRQTEVLHEDAAQLALASVLPAPEGVTRLDRNALRSALADTALRLVADMLMQIGGTSYRPRFRSLAPLCQRINSTETFRTTLAGCLIEANETTITIRPEHP